MAPTAAMRVAIGQPTMHWDIDGNLREVEAALRASAARGAELVLFPELTLTGLHTRVPAMLEPAPLQRALEAVAQLCRSARVAAAVGLPLWSGGERPLDAMVAFDAQGSELLRSAKFRLMPPGEPMVFDAGNQRPVVEHLGRSLAFVICREILDRAELARELSGKARILLWPGMMARPPRPANDPDGYVAQAIGLAVEQDAWIFHSNWALNVEAPQLPNTGKSLVISPQGEVVLEAPARQAGLLLGWERPLQRAWVPMGSAPGA